MITDSAHTPTIATIDSNLIEIPGGLISLRDEGTKRHWTVKLKPFLLSKFAITKEQYRALLRGGGSNDNNRQLPAVDVSWHDAIRFCNELSRNAGLQECYSTKDDTGIACDWEANGYRLPSEAEWEYACRAGSNEPRYGALDTIAWYSDNSAQTMHEVGLKAPNQWDLYDMLGNVWEWCWDIYDKEKYGDYRVFRGGGWSDPPEACRASCRRKSHPTFRIDDLGFRLTRSMPS